jgi:hypothetical protein
MRWLFGCILYAAVITAYIVFCLIVSATGRNPRVVIYEAWNTSPVPPLVVRSKWWLLK